MPEPTTTHRTSAKRTTASPAAARAGELAHSLGALADEGTSDARDRAREAGGSAAQAVQETLAGASDKAQEALDGASRRAQEALGNLGDHVPDQVGDGAARAREALGDVGDQVTGLQESAPAAPQRLVEWIQRNPVVVVGAVVLLVVLGRVTRPQP